MSDNLPATGTAGAVPPPDAPHEVSQPLTPEYERTALARARENERELAPLTYGAPVQHPPAGTAVPSTGGVGEATQAASEGKLDPFYQRMREGGQMPPAVDTAAASSGQPAGQPIKKILRRNRPPVEGSHAGPSGDRAGGADPGVGHVAPAPGTPVVADPLAPIDLSHMPAASNSDSPTRGIPRNLPTDPGKAITGGFGDAAALQYYALDGGELKTLVEQLMDDVHARLQNDLRFNEAITYPQVTARVVIEIAGFATDSAFTVEKILPSTHPARATNPLEFARSVADEVCFVVVAEMRETDDQGQSVTPPDAVRQELGLPRPQKHWVRDAGGRPVTMVDRRT